MNTRTLFSEWQSPSLTFGCSMGRKAGERRFSLEGRRGTKTGLLLAAASGGESLLRMAGAESFCIDILRLLEQPGNGEDLILFSQKQ